MPSDNRAVVTLREMLEGGRFGEGAKLPPERELAEEMGIQRNAIRNALSILEAEGRIWRHVGKGTFVGSRRHGKSGGLEALAQDTNPMEVMETRLIFEPQLAKLCALRATPVHIAELRTCLKRGDEATSVRQFEIWDSHLHKGIAEGSVSALLKGIFDAVNAVRDQSVWGELKERSLNPTVMRKYAGQHHKIVEAIERRDPAEAESTMRAHLREVRYDILGE